MKREIWHYTVNPFWLFAWTMTKGPSLSALRRSGRGFARDTCLVHQVFLCIYGRSRRDQSERLEVRQVDEYLTFRQTLSFDSSVYIKNEIMAEVENV